AVVTVTWAVPALPEGATARSAVSDRTVNDSASVEPNLTAVAALKPEPVTVISSPPAGPPPEGGMAPTDGAAGAEEGKLLAPLEKESVEVAYYVSSSGAAASVLARGIRLHWGIENGCHWVLDVTFGEDRCRTRQGHAAENLAWLRKIVLSLL